MEGAPPTFNDIPEESLKLILRFVGNDPASYFSCERTCRSFRRTLANDQVWRFCKGSVHGRGDSHRERVLIQLHLAEVRKYQRKARYNVFVEVLGVQGSKKMIQNLRPCWNKLRVRGDTLAALLEIVQGFMVNMLEEAICLTIHRSDREYPVLSERDLKLWMGLREKWTRGEGRAISMRISSNSIGDKPSSDLVDASLKTSIVRQLAYIGGVVKFTKNAFDCIWDAIIRMMVVLVEYALIELEACHAEPYSAEDEIDFDNDLPPSFRLSGNHDDFLIIPRFIFRSAERFGIPKAFGYGWLVEEDKTLGQEMAEVEALYRVKGDASHVELSLEDDDSGFDSSEDDFSIYNDDDCEDGI